MKASSESASVGVFPCFRYCMIILTTAAILTMPAFWSGNIITGDALSHLVMSRHFINQLISGEPYPRWLSDLNDGLGSPVMFFYGPVPYYITALFRPLVDTDPEGWHQLGLAASLAVLVSGFTMYAWLRQFNSSTAAMIGAIFYMGEPYHLSVDLYLRFAFAELWAFAWMPLILLMVHRVMVGYKGAIYGLSLSYALLIMTHLPTTLLFSIVPPLYALFRTTAEHRWVAFMYVVLGMLLGIGLSAVFLFPAMQLQSAVQLAVMESGKSFYGNNFIFYGPRADSWGGKYSRLLSPFFAESLLLILGAYLLGRGVRTHAEERAANFWLVTGILAFFMVLPISKPVWEFLVVIQKVQFPSRFGTVLSISMIALLSIWMSGARKLFSRSNTTELMIVGLIGLSQVLPLLQQYRVYSIWSHKPSLDWLESWVVSQDPIFRSSVDIVIAAKMNGYVFFLPNNVDNRLGDTKTSLIILKKLSVNRDVELIQPTASVVHYRLSHISSRHIALSGKSYSNVWIKIRQFYFPGWVATVRGSGEKLDVRPSSSTGLIELKAPLGQHDIDLTLNAGLAEKAGGIFSLCSLMVCLVGWLWGRYQAKGRRPFAVKPEIENCDS